MIITLALRNLIHDRIRLAVTLVGILFSIVLMAVQLGMFLGSSDHITAMIERSKSDLWITAFGAKSFEEGGVLLSERERHQALAVNGVKAVVPLVVAFAEWRKPEGGSTRVVLVGTDAEDGLSRHGRSLRETGRTSSLQTQFRLTTPTSASSASPGSMTRPRSPTGASRSRP